MARKKKPTRKFIPRNEFRFNNSPHADGHPQYVFGEQGKKFKSIGLTRNPVQGIPHVKLTKNPNPADASDSYLQLIKPHTAKKSYYGEPLSGWEFHPDDMPIVRHRIKRYKKSMNRKPPMWYEKKRKKK